MGVKGSWSRVKDLERYDANRAGIHWPERDTSRTCRTCRQRHKQKCFIMSLDDTCKDWRLQSPPHKD